MCNYIIYKSEYSCYDIVEILNECDLYEVQREFVDKGYVIIDTTENHIGYYLKVRRVQGDVESE